ncbi:MAG: DUF502 domain-containing protein [Chitinispirillaceae bacterium]|nr:DUF502 domain-containing protein [Chitinispirillaceae bacterium]
MKIMLRRAFALFIQGLLALLPLIVSINVMLFAFSFVEGMAVRLLGILPATVATMQFIRFGIQLVLMGLLFISVMFFGMVVRTMIGSTLMKWIDGFFGKVPGLNTIYFSTRQVVDVFRSGKKQFFTSPVLVEYPSTGIWSIGFNTGELVMKENGFSDSKVRFTIFIPTTPNPTSGFLAVMTEDKIRKLDISIEEAIKMILTGGMVKNNRMAHQNGYQHSVGEH